jgi:hypothetical protein
MRLMELCRRSWRLTGAARTELTSGRSRSSSSSISWKRQPSLYQNPRSLLGSLALQLIQVGTNVSLPLRFILGSGRSFRIRIHNYFLETWICTRTAKFL